MPLITRTDKGSPLSIAEMDGNLDYCSPGTYLEVDISSAQILAMGTTPIDILPAPGAGKYYDFTAIVEFTAGTSYVFTGDTILLGGSDSYGGGLINPSFIATTNNKVAKVGHQPTEMVTSDATEYPTTWEMVLNEGIIFTALNGNDPTTGTGTIKVKIWYKLRTFG
jgi:hypothetical protein